MDARRTDFAVSQRSGQTTARSLTGSQTVSFATGSTSCRAKLRQSASVALPLAKASLTWSEKRYSPYCFSGATFVRGIKNASSSTAMSTAATQAAFLPTASPSEIDFLIASYHEITEATIRVLVDSFYARVRRDPALGPIFSAAI